jgi:hypothetical protein
MKGDSGSVETSPLQQQAQLVLGSYNRNPGSAFWNFSKMVGARSHFGSFIIVSSPVTGSMR